MMPESETMGHFSELCKVKYSAVLFAQIEWLWFPRSDVLSVFSAPRAFSSLTLFHPHHHTLF